MLMFISCVRPDRYCSPIKIPGCIDGRIEICMGLDGECEKGMTNQASPAFHTDLAQSSYTSQNPDSDGGPAWGPNLPEAQDSQSNVQILATMAQGMVWLNRKLPTH